MKKRLCIWAYYAPAQVTSKQCQSLGKSARKTYAWAGAFHRQTKTNANMPNIAAHGLTTTGVNSATHTLACTQMGWQATGARPLWAAISHVINSVQAGNQATNEPNQKLCKCWLNEEQASGAEAEAGQSGRRQASVCSSPCVHLCVHVAVSVCGDILYTHTYSAGE